MNWVAATVGIIFLICIIIGICQGAIRIAVSLATTLVTLLIVFFATPYVAKAIAQYTPVDEMIEQQVSAAIMDAVRTHLSGDIDSLAGGGISREDVEDALGAAGISEADLEAQGISVDDIMEGNIDDELLSQLGIEDKLPSAEDESSKEEEDGGEGSILDNVEIPRDLQQEAINAADMPDIFKDLLSVNNNSEIYEELGVNTFAQYVGSFLAKLIINIISYLGTFVIVTIILRAIIFALDIIAELPVLGLINRLAGGAIGFVGAAIIVWILFIVVTLLYTTVIGKDVYLAIQGNGILKFLYDNNPIMGMAAKI